jgi:hypothetical protein
MGKGADAGIAATIRKSPVMMVTVVTGMMLYLPAALAVAASGKKRFLDAVNPKTVFNTIRVMEIEYLAVVVFAVLQLVGALTVGRWLEPLPVIGRLFLSVAAVYIVLAGGFVLGRVHARFAERLEPSNNVSTSGPE